jgi:periplasmic divalent cation tolerance protein
MSKKEDDGLIIVQVTTKDEAEARKLAQLLLDQKQAACVNIVPKVSTLYRWQGKIETGTESLMTIKSRAALLDDIISLVKTYHSYDLPEVITTPIIGGNPAYLDWLKQETA